MRHGWSLAVNQEIPMTKIYLNNGIEMPLVGLGTAFIPFNKLERVVEEAYEVGYRKFDTAWIYNNEEILGKSIQNLHIDRESVFLTTKLHARDLYYFGERRFSFPKKKVKTAIEGHLKRLSTDYIDLLLIHWPFRQYLNIWEQLVKVYQSSDCLVRAIGVSSWYGDHIDRAVKTTGVYPALNQFEINPFQTNEDLIKVCKNKGVLPESYSSFGSQNSKEILGNYAIVSIAEKQNRTPSQVILRWLTQRGISVVPRSTSKNHLKENLNIFDFELSSSEINLISSLNQNRYSRFNPQISLNWV